MATEKNNSCALLCDLQRIPQDHEKWLQQVKGNLILLALCTSCYGPWPFICSLPVRLPPPSPFLRFTVPVTKNISASSHSVAEGEGHEFITIKTALAPASLVQRHYLQCIDSEQPFGKKEKTLTGMTSFIRFSELG